MNSSSSNIQTSVARIQSNCAALQEQISSLAAEVVQYAQLDRPSIEYLADQIKELKRQITTSSTPWLTREGATIYAGYTNPKSIDALRASGLLRTYWVNGAPRFKKADIDKLIENGKAPAVGRGGHKRAERIRRLRGEL